jgi:hypothetical protein
LNVVSKCAAWMIAHAESNVASASGGAYALELRTAVAQRSEEPDARCGAGAGHPRTREWASCPGTGGYWAMAGRADARASVAVNARLVGRIRRQNAVSMDEEDYIDARGATAAPAIA